MTRDWRKQVNRVLAVVLCLFGAIEVNYPRLMPQSQLAIFAMLGLVLCFLNIPFKRGLEGHRLLRRVDLGIGIAAIACCAYVVIQTEPLFQSLWIGGQTLGNRAGLESRLDIVVGCIGLLIVLEATRRSIGLALPILALTFIVYAFVGPWLPGWLFPHRGYDLSRIVAQTFLHTQGVFGTALRVMFTYVFLFVVFGAFLKQTGATQFIIDFAQRIFGKTPGGPAKVAVLSSGLMGSLSGSAVANTATTGTFTIPLMRSSGFRAEIAAGVEAAASSGGALVPPVMGAGAYMMLEIIDPPVTYLQIVKAAIVPALLYYVSLLLIVHFYARRVGAGRQTTDVPKGSIFEYEGLVFLSGFVVLLGLLIAGFTVFRSVTLATLAVFVSSLFRERTRITGSRLLEAFRKSALDVIPLINAAACVGVVIGVVTLTGIGTRLPSAILELSQGSLLAALFLIMVSSIVLGMGLPSAVCYLLMATLVGPVLGDLGVVPLSAHLFIFYFGMMSMVTPPVALAAYTAGSIAGAGIMETGIAAFRFALVGFTLPYMFVLRPELLMLDGSGEPASAVAVLGATLIAVLGIVPFAAGIAGHLFGPLGRVARTVLFVAAALLLVPHSYGLVMGTHVSVLDLAGVVLMLGVGIANWRTGSSGSLTAS